MTNSEIEKKVVDAIEQLRPFMHADGGDIEFVGITEDLKVRVKLLGACSECSMSPMTLKAGLVDALKVAVPQIVGVVSVEDEN